MEKVSKVWEGKTIGLDVGDRSSTVCVLDTEGEVIEESVIRTTPTSIRSRFGSRERLRVVLETGVHANWLHDELEGLGHEVIVANARRVRAICEADQKNDRSDAEQLARLGRADVRLLSPVDPRSVQTRRDLEVIRARAQLVEVRTRLVNHVRGAVKSMGMQLAKCSTESFHRLELPHELAVELKPMMELIRSTSAAIEAYDEQLTALAAKYPQAGVLRQVKGVGPVTSVCFVLTIGDPGRFKDSRQVAAYLGLTPGQRQSGESNPKQRITKSGDAMLRTLLVQGAQYILRRSSPDTALKRFGTRLAQRGGKGSKPRAVVATARKLSVLLLALWKSGELYEPLRGSSPTLPKG
jgi:transposase